MTPNLSLFHLTTPGAVQVLTRPENLKFYSDPRFEQIFGTLADLLPALAYLSNCNENENYVSPKPSHNP